MAKVTLEDVSKVYPGGARALSDFNLDIQDGEFMVFVGPSGCGKTTALRMIAGLEEITAGSIRVGDRVVNDLSPRDRDIAMVFQNYALYPHMTVSENMAFSLRLKKVDKQETENRVRQAAELLGIEEFLDRKPRQLSGGQRQRVAMGRAIVREPAAFLMDEPLSNLDAKLRVQMRTEIARLHQRLGTTTVYVTHDQVEAVTMADRVAVIRGGYLQQVATPEDLYERPINLFVAGFIGSPAMNMVQAKPASDDGLAISFAEHSLKIPDAVAKDLPPVREYLGTDLIMGIRPEDFEDPAFLPQGQPSATLPVTIGLIEMLGSEKVAYFDVNSPPVVTKDTQDLAKDLGGEDGPRPVGVTTFTARLNPRTKIREGDRVELAVDLRRLYFFDPASGEAIGR